MSFRRGKRIIQSQDDKGEKYIELGERLIPRGITTSAFGHQTSSITHHLSSVYRYKGNIYIKATLYIAIPFRINQF